MDSLPMPLPDYKRYGRQMVLDGFGLDAQLKLRNAKVVVVGAGGLGCPALQYLATAGIGTLGIVDHDVVELSNLQRQILHTEERIGQFKADSAAAAVKSLNSSIQVEVHKFALISQNARSILSQYDVILDCTDNAPTRYLLSDTAVTLGKPLVSGAALKYDGQLCTYNIQPNGPCYRCIFPKPPSLELFRTCEDSGVLGVVTGTIGSLQALEAIKLIIGKHEGPSLLLFSALGLPPFRTVKIRGKRAQCAACGTAAEKKETMEETDYVAFCGGTAPDWEAKGLVPGPSNARTTPEEVKTMLSTRSEDSKLTILDVRSEAEFSICHLDNSKNIPISLILHNPASYLPEEGPIIVVCKLGNDSQLAAKSLMDVDGGTGRNIRDMIGGLRSWSRLVDPTFPVY